ncbi:MAG: MSCRAMM family adhesin SdrC [Armatimonadetes bacterium]|nr:MSCRAMM family adhesin SdrC [Armatimonadota bacterium]
MKSFIIALLLLASALSVSLAQIPGAIWTTDADCLAVNRNIFYAKTDVYLNGGPSGKGGLGLPDGNYYYQVTDPSGSVLLSTAPLEERVVEVVGGWITSCKQLYPFDDTPNPGGEYKVWVTAVADYDPLDPAAVFGFVPAKSKTDNFRVKSSEDGGGVQSFFSLSGYKYYDLDLDGERDTTEGGIPYWKIALFENSISPENLVGIQCTSPGGDGVLPGYYLFPNLAPGTYVVVELMPLGPWLQTGPKESSIDLNPDPMVTVTTSKYNDLGVVYIVVVEEGIQNLYAVENIDFGNICLGAGGGKTLGFWTNKNGQAILQNPEKWSIVVGSGALSCPVLAGLPYTRAEAPYLNSPGEIKRFLINANAVDMRYMLAAQWLAMGLNVLVGDVNPSSIIYMGNGTFKTIIEILDDVCTNGASWDRMTQEYFKDALDKANNNMNFVQPAPCPVVYDDTLPPCPGM